MNKKRLFKFIAVSSVFTVSAVAGIALAGCNGCNKHTHDLTEVEAVAATCTEDGNHAYWVCSGCDLIFADGEGKTETTAEDVAESKLGHDLSKHVEAEAATCTKPGNIEYWECSRGDGKFKDAQGMQAVTDVVTTKSHTWGANGHHEMVYPTTETEGTKEYWECDECGNVYLDSYGDTVTTKDKLSIDKVLDNIDGVVGSAYTQSTAYVIGRDVANGGVGIIANAFLGKDGVYLHITLNHNSSPDEQSQGHGKVGVYMNIRNENNLYLPGDAGTSFREGVGIELYINGKVEQQQPFSLKHFENKTNAEGAATAYTTVWELFMPNAELAKANSGKLSGAFEEKDGKTLLKQGYNVLMTVCGNLTLNEKDRFDDGDGSVCKYNHNNGEWTFIYREGYGDWGTDQKYMVVGKDGFSKTHVRGTDVYNVNMREYANATLSAQLPATVDWDGKLQGKLTVDSGYILTGIKINGKAAYTGGALEGGSLVYDFEIDIEGLDLAWNVTDLDVEFVVIEANYVDAAFTLKGNSGGKHTAVAEGTQITLVDDFGNEISAEVGANGSVTVNNLLCQHYVVKINDYLDGEMYVISADVGDVVVEYEFASPIGDVSHLVDLSHMNDESATITMGANGLNGLGQGEYAQGVGVEINIPEDMKNGAYILETTVSVNDPLEKGAWLQRFAITFAQGDENKYKNKFVIWWNDLLTNEFPSAIWADDATPCGGAFDRNKSFDWLAEAVMDGLRLKVVRNGEYVAVSAYNFDAEEWVTLLEGKTSATAANRIAFHVSGESWTFSDISFEKLEVIETKLPSGDTSGIFGHLKASNGDLFNLNGTMTTEEDLVLTAASVNLSISAFEKDGETEVTLANGTQITLKGKYQTYMYTVGETTQLEMVAGEYEAFLYGYGAANVTVTETGEDVVIVLVQTIAYGYGEASVDNGNGTVTITGSGCPADGTPWSGYAEIVTDQTNADKAFEFTVKDTNVRDGDYDWAARRIAVQVAGNNGFFIWFNSADEVAVRKLIATNVGPNGGGQGGAYEGDLICTNHGWMKALVEGDGLQFRILRYGTKIILSAYNGSEWIVIGSVECGADDETNPVFYAQGDDYEFSAVSDKNLEFVEAKDATLESAGNIAYYTDGVNYYLPDGSLSDAEEVIIPQIVEQSVEIMVVVYGTDGEAIENEDLSGVKVSLTGEYGYNNNVYTNLGIEDGKLVFDNGKIYAGKYSVTVNGYAVADIIVGTDTQELTVALHKIAGYNAVEITKTYKPENVQTGFNESGVNFKLIGSSGDWTDYNNPVPEATLTLPDGVAASKNVTVEFNLKLTRQGFWGTNAFGVSVVKDYGGFILRTFGSDATEIDVSELYAQKLCEDGMKFLGKNAWIKGLALSDNGLNLRVVRNGASIALVAQDAEGTWQLLFAAACAADAETEIKFMTGAADFTVSKIKANATAEGELVFVAAKAPTSDEAGNIAYYSYAGSYITTDFKPVTPEQFTLPKLLATPTYTFDGSDETEFTKDARGEEVALSENGMVFTTNASGDWADYEANPMKISVTQTFGKEKEVEINFNLKGANQVFWASGRFGIEVAGTSGLFVWNNDNAGMICGIVDETMKTETAKLGEYKWLGNAIASDGGANFKLIRKGDTIRCYAHNGTEWLYLGSVACSAEDETQIKFIAKGATWTVSDLTVSEIVAEETEE